MAKKPHYTVRYEEDGVLFRCDSCNKTLGFFGKDEVQSGLAKMDEHQEARHPEFVGAS